MKEREKRVVQSNREGQDYAHQYNLNNNQEYQYPNETKRIKYRVNSDTNNVKDREQLYNLNPTSYEIQTPQGIPIRKTKEDVMQENFQRSYKIKHKPPIRSGTDPGSESYLLPNDYRQDEIDHIQKGMNQFEQKIFDERNIDLTNAGQRNLLVMENRDCQTVCPFCVGDKVLHNEEGLDGEVSFANDSRITIVWADKTRERFTLGEANKYLTNLAYVDTAQSLVDPLNTPPAQKNELSEVSKKAMDLFEDEIDQEIQEDVDFDIDKLKLQRKVGQLENKLNQIDINKMKENAARELVDLMLKKGMLEQDEDKVEEQVGNIMEMDDYGYEMLKNVVLSTKSKPPIDDVLAILDGDDLDDDIEIEDGREYARMKEEMKKQASPTRTVDGIEMGDTSFLENGGLKNFQPRLGGFGKDDNVRGVESRNLSNGKKPKTIEKKSNLNLSGFENLQGLTTPINIPSKEHTPSTKYSDLFSNMNWTTITKSF